MSKRNLTFKSLYSMVSIQNKFINRQHECLLSEFWRGVVPGQRITLLTREVCGSRKVLVLDLSAGYMAGSFY